MGPFVVDESSDFSTTIWAGAGRCDLSKGTLVGDGRVLFRPDENKIVIQLDIDDKQVTEVHAWVGKTVLPMSKDCFGYDQCVISPGRWPLNEDVQPGQSLTFDYDFSLSGIKAGDKVYVVVHSVVATCEGCHDAVPPQCITPAPTVAATPRPTYAPTSTKSPTGAPTGAPTKAPTKAPTAAPTNSTTGCKYTKNYCTSFGYSPTFPTSSCYSSFCSAKNWGWSMGKVSCYDGYSHEFDIHAGAAQCDITKGVRVGHGKITHWPSKGYCDISVDTGDHDISEIHFWSGKTYLPKDSYGNYLTSPGRWPLSKTCKGERTWRYYYGTDQNIKSGDYIYSAAHWSVALDE